MQCQVYEPAGLPWINFAAISCVHIRDEDDPQKIDEAHRTIDGPRRRVRQRSRKNADE